MEARGCGARVGDTDCLRVFSAEFENFDQFVRQFNGVHMMGFTVSDWLFSGVVKLNWFPGFEMRYLNASSIRSHLPPIIFYVISGRLEWSFP